VRHPQNRREDRRQRDMPAHEIDRDAIEARSRLHAASKGTPFSLMRQRVLAVLGMSDKPLTAYEIVKQISDTRKVHGVESIERSNSYRKQAASIGWHPGPHISLVTIFMERERRSFS